MTRADTYGLHQERGRCGAVLFNGAIVTTSPRPIVVSVSPADIDLDLIRLAAQALRDGQLVAFPTETVYGLGCNALDEAAIAKVFEAKGRPSSDPLIVHVDGLPMVETVIDGPISPAARALAEAFWPGPLTMILPRGNAVPLAVTSGLDSVAVRCPSHPVAAALIREAGIPVTAPSANRFNHISPTSAHHVIADLGGVTDIIIDSGRTEHGLESTVVSLDGADVTILRHGAITVEQLANVGGIRIVDDGTSVDSPASPGHEKRHYSPNTPTVALRSDSTVLADLPGTDPAANASVIYGGYSDREPELPPTWRFEPLGSLASLEAVGHDLYFHLRRIDALAADVLIVELTGAPGLGRAIDDRLTRAAGSTITTTAAELVGAMAEASRTELLDP